MSRPLDPRLLRRAPATRRFVAQLAGMQVAGAALVVAHALLLADVVAGVFGSHDDARRLLDRLVLLALIGTLRAGLAGVQESLGAGALVRIRVELRRAALAAIVRLGPAWTKRQSPGRLVTATGPGLDALDGYVTRALPALVSAAAVPGVALVAILVVDWQSGLILLGLLPLVPLFMVLIGMTTDRLVARRYVTLGRLAGQFLDLLRGLTTLRVYGQAERQEQTLARATEAYRRQTVATLRIAFLSGLVLDLIAALSVAVVAVDVGLRLDSGRVSFGVALSVLLLAPEVFAPLRAIGAQHHARQEGVVAAAAALDLMDEADLVPAGSGSAGTGAGSGRLVLDGVSLTYPARTNRALENVSVVIEPGRIVALTGPSGAGKSSVLALLLGFVTATGGDVRTGDGVPLDSLDPGAWRSRVAWLPQRPRPSRATVEDEVRLGDPAAADAEVAEVCRRCRTPERTTPLGEDGRSVSAGQRRRIALARALLRAEAVRRRGEVPLVLLDEPSEDLDRATERVVASVVSGMRGWATVVLATHSPLLTAVADEHVELEHGRIVAATAQAPHRPDDLPQTAAEPARARPPTGVATPAARLPLRELIRGSGAGRRLGLAALLSASSALAGLGLAASSMWLIGRAAQHPNVQALALAVVAVRTFAIGRALLRYLERLVTHDAALAMLTGLRARVFAALRALAPTVLGNYGRGDLLRRFVGDVDGAQEGLVRALVPACGAATGALAAIGIAALLQPAAAAVLAAGLAIAGVLVPLLSFRAARRRDGSVEAAGVRDRGCAGLVDSLEELTAYGATRSVLEQVAADDVAVGRLGRGPALIAGLGTAACGTTAAVTVPVVIALAAQAVATGGLSVVQVGVLAVCALAGFDAVSTLPAAYVAWARCRAGLRRVGEITTSPAALDEPAVPESLPGAPFGLCGEAIALSPAAGVDLVLRDAGLVLRPGTRLAVVGPSGCGKSTLLTAALRLLPLTGGRLALTGAGRSVDLVHLAARDVPPVAAGSLQGDHVFDSTLRDNLRVVRPGATDADLDAVARRVGLDDLIGALPAGWSTPAGPDGAALSGGERQRLLLARALLADPHILVLDEPTAHLDAATERLVMADLLDATAGRTMLMTTHRDVGAGVGVLRLEHGELVGQHGPALAPAR